MKLNINMKKTNFTSHKQQLFVLFFSGNLNNKINTDQSILQCFYSLWKEIQKKQPQKYFSPVGALLGNLLRR